MKIFSVECKHEGGEKMLTLDQYTTIQVLHQQGWKIKRMSRELGLDRNTVRQALRRPYQRQRIRRAETLLGPWRDCVKQRAIEVRYNAVRLYEDLRLKGYQGSYQTVNLAVRPLRQDHRFKESATVRFETPAGQQAQVDWGSSQVLLGDAWVRVHFFVMTLGYCRRCYVEATLDEKLGTFLCCHEHAFEWFGGMPYESLYDNPKTVVVQHDSKGRVLRWNPIFLDFMNYYGVTPKVCPLYRARTKGKTESGVKYVKRNFLAGRTFQDLQDVNEQLKGWMTSVADVRVHGTTHQKPIERFCEEQKVLLAWGTRPLYVLPQRLERRVASDCLVDFETNRYSVPAQYVGQRIALKLKDAETIEVVHQGEVIAIHRRAKERYRWVVEPAHWQSLKKQPMSERSLLTPRCLSAGGQESPGLVRDLSVYEEVCHG